MHIPDGFIDAPVSIAAAGAAVVAVGVSLRGARRELQHTPAPLAGLTAVFIFAAQMVNFPVGPGTSGHLIGAALAAILIGPFAAVLALTMVLVVQALVFADGGLSALGLNVLNLAVVATLVGWLVFRAVVRWAPRRNGSDTSPAVGGSEVAGKSTAIVPGRALTVSRGPVLTAAFAAGFVSVLAAAATFSLEFALGGTAPLSVATVTTAMLSVHAVIGIGEGLITALVIGAVMVTRPDLVYGLRRERIHPPRPVTRSSSVAS